MISLFNSKSNHKAFGQIRLYSLNSIEGREFLTPIFMRAYIMHLRPQFLGNFIRKPKISDFLSSLTFHYMRVLSEI